MSLASEKLLPLNEVEMAGDPDRGSRWRWCVTGRDGIILESTHLEGDLRRYTSVEAVARFEAAVRAKGGWLPIEPDYMTTGDPEGT